MIKNCLFCNMFVGLINWVKNKSHDICYSWHHLIENTIPFFLFFSFFGNFKVHSFVCKEVLICNFDFLVVVVIIDFPTTNLKTCSVAKSIVVNVCCLCV
jgi:hypothetical protein